MMFEGIDQDGQKLVDLLYAPAYTKLCLTAIEMDVFSHFATPKTAAELAEEMGWHAENTGHFLDALAGMGLLRKESGAYQNAAPAAKYLVQGNPRYMGAFMQMYAGLGGFEQADFAALVREGPQAAKESPVNNVSFADQLAAMRKGQTGERAFETVQLLNSLPEFATAKKLLDLGCGTGMLGLAAAQKNPALSVVLFDTPQMEPGIRESIAQSGLAARATALGGDYIGGDVGEGYDIILAFATLNFAKPVLGEVMRKLHAALNPGGVLVISSDGISADGTKPAEMVAGWLHYTMQGMDFRMFSGVVPKAALAAGFESIHTMQLPSCSGMAEVNLLRKGKA